MKRLLFLGSSCIYPRDCPQPIKEEYLLSGPLEATNRAYALAKLAFTDGKSYQFMASQMTGMTEKEYVDMMVAGGRSPDGARSKSEWKGKK